MILTMIETPTNQYLQVPLKFMAEHLVQFPYSFSFDQYAYIGDEFVLLFLKTPESDKFVEDITDVEMDEEAEQWTLGAIKQIQVDQMILNNEKIPDHLMNLVERSKLNPKNQNLQ